MPLFPGPSPGALPPTSPVAEAEPPTPVVLGPVGDVVGELWLPAFW
jgi:hypothetical protein